MRILSRVVSILEKLTKRQHLDFSLIVRFGNLIGSNYRFKWPQMDWWSCQKFNLYLEKFGEAEGFNTDRKWALSQLLRLTASVEGDTAECGVYRGASSYLICSSNQGTEKHHFMFDSYEGLSQPKLEDGEYWSEGCLSANEDIVHQNLSTLANFSTLKGWIPEKFSEVDDRKFSFVHIDVDLYQPTKDSISFFYDRLNTGGIILCDDYGFSTCPGATRGIDEFLEDKPEKMISLSGGGGFMIRGVKTAIS